MVGRMLLEVAVLVASGVVIGLAVEWLRPHVWDLHMLISSTLLFRRIRAEDGSRKPDGSTNAGSRVDPQHSLPARAGVEPADRFAVPPAHPNTKPEPSSVKAWRTTSDTAVHHPRTAVSGSPLAPVDADVSRGSAFTGLNSAGAGATPPTSPAPAGLHSPVGTDHPHLPSVPTGLPSDGEPCQKKLAATFALPASPAQPRTGGATDG